MTLLEPRSPAGPTLAQRTASWGEPALALAVCTLASLLVMRRLLEPGVYSDDALVHQYWMWHWRDPQLFGDPLTEQLRASARYPDGYQALFWLASHVTAPIWFGEWLGVALMAGSAWLVFAIVRDHEPWRPAAWVAAALFLALVDIHRFHGGFPRGFVHPVVLLTVLLAMRRREVPAALAAAGGALLYPPAAVLAIGVLAISAVRLAGRRPRLDRRRAVTAAVALGLALAVLLGKQLLAGGAPRVFTAGEARAFPEFGSHGTLRFFASSTLDYLRQNRSGFDLRASGSVLAAAAVALLLIRPATVRKLRAEVLALPVAALGAYALAQAVLFRLYLPHRYTYPLVAFFAIAVGVALRPAWAAPRSRSPIRACALLLLPPVAAVVALYAFPLGPLRPLSDLTSRAALAAFAAVAVAAAVTALMLGRAPARRRVALGAALTGACILVAMLATTERWARGTACPAGPAIRFLAQLPKDAIVAGDPIDLKCLPATARRAVVISTQLAPAYEADYFAAGRARMFAMLRAYYGPSPNAIAELRTRYGATHLWVRSAAVRKELRPGGARWRRRELPYGRFVRSLLATGEPAVLRLPPRCLRWRRGEHAVYDVACLASD